MFSLVLLIAENGRATHAFATLLSIPCAFTFRRSLLSFEMPLVYIERKAPSGSKICLYPISYPRR